MFNTNETQLFLIIEHELQGSQTVIKCYVITKLVQNNIKCV